MADTLNISHSSSLYLFVEWEWLNHYPWKCPKDVWMWHLGIWFSGEHDGAGLTAQ